MGEGLMPQVSRQVELGRSGSVPEVMVKWEGHPVPAPIVYHRTSSMVAYADINGPDDLLNDAWRDIVGCALSAAGAATLAAIIAGPVGALPAFKAVFSPCLVTKMEARAGEVQVALSTQQKANEDW